MATAGHVDHGKSALVKALTGTDPDRLPEEKARGITIDLGFAHLELSGPAPDSPLPPAPASPGATAFASASPQAPAGAPIPFRVGLIDVPGHEDFVKNMVAGVGSIDLVLFIVAADDGWMPQTEEHVQILSYLGVRHAVVALTKIDLASEREAALVSQIRAQLENTPFANAPVVATSVISGRGLEELRYALLATLAAMPEPADAHKPRLPIDRVFTLRGIGTVVTGTLSGGVLRRNQAVVLQPAGQATRIRSLQHHNCEVEQALPGTRTALNLPDLPAARGSSAGVARGQVVTVTELGHPTRTIDVWLERSERVLEGQEDAGRPLKDGARVRFHHGSAHTPARVVLLEDASLLPGRRALAQIRTEKPVFVLGGDRFILRDWPEQRTLAGGLVLEASAPRRAIRDETRRALLRERALHAGESSVWLRTELQKDHACKADALLAQTRWSNSEVQDALSRLASEGRITIEADWALDAAWWQQLKHFAAGLIQAEHRMHPERPGLALSELRRALEGRLPDPSLGNLLLAALARQGYAQAGTVIRHESHRLALPPPLQSAGGRLRSALAAKPFEPPPKKELVTDAVAQQALRFLIDNGEAVELSPDLVMLAEPFARACELIRRQLQETGPATASDLRQLLGTNRRVIIPLLERMDRDGMTLRQGDRRVLKAKTQTQTQP